MTPRHPQHSTGPLSVIEPESCDDCGLCCEGIGSPVLLYVTRDDESENHPFRPPDLPAELQREIDEAFAGLHRGEEPQERCLWFDPVTRRCRHYDWRPRFCVEYELGGRECLARRRKSARAE